MADVHHRTKHLLSVALLSLFALAAGTPTPAQAQFGKLLKKAKHAVAPSTGAKAGHGPPKFDAVILELAPDRVASVIKGLHGQATALQGTNGNGVDALRQQASAARKAADALAEKYDSQRDAYDAATDKIQHCRVDAFTDREDIDEKQREAAANSTEADDSIQTAKFKKELLTAVQNHDAQKIAALQKEMMQMASGSMNAGGAQQAMDDSLARADTAAVDRRCGKLPPKPRFLVQIDSLNNAAQDALAQARSTEERGRSAGAQAAGMTEPQFAMAIERIQYYLSGERWAFTEPELDALDARKDALKQAMHDARYL